jgi:competence protein CoiA
MILLRQKLTKKISNRFPPFIIMLCAIRSSDGKSVRASEADNSGNTFYCPVCDSLVVPSKDEAGMDYFIHAVPGVCSYGLGETKIHRRCKAEIYSALLRSPHVSDVKLERYLKEVRPDISARINGVPVAIEVQISNIPVDTVIHRTKIYERMGIHLLWLAQWTPDLNRERYSPRPWERWVHTAYFGRVYYWLEGSLVMPYHFEPSHIYVEKHSWQKQNGRKKVAGGYSRRSKRYIRPVRGDVLDLLKDFDARKRDWWSGGNIIIPPARLYCHSGPRFWKDER